MSKEAMKRFLIDTPVNNAEGSQVWYVDAASEAEALEKYKQGECDLYASEVDVTSLGEPEISGETTLDDFGDFAEQPAQQEPVARVFNKSISWRPCDIAGLPAGTPLYTSPPAQRTWVGLTDEERQEIWKGCDPTHAGYVTALVEDKLKEKNT